MVSFYYDTEVTSCSANMICVTIKSKITFLMKKVKIETSAKFPGHSENSNFFLHNSLLFSTVRIIIGLNLRYFQQQYRGGKGPFSISTLIPYILH